MGRAPCCDKANVKRGPWSPEEDAKLKSYIDEYGTGGNWIALPRKIGLKRCGKSCRLRWLNYLRPNIKHGSFSEEEDHIICNLYLNIGSRWSIIASQLPGRTDNDIKNYWNTRLKKKLMGMQRKDQQISKRGGQVKQEMKRQVLEDTNAPSLSTSMNLYQSFFPTEFPLILTNFNHHGQELHIKPQDPTCNQYPFDTTSIQTELFDQSNKNQFPNIQYSASVDVVNVFQDFNNYPFEINEFNYNTSQLEHFDGLVLANLINGSNCTSSSGESTTSWGDHPLALYPRLSSIGYEDCQRGLLQNSPVDLPSRF